jgi:hypothetical protein
LNWLRAAFRAAWEGLKRTTKNVATFFVSCVRRATQRLWVLPLAVAAAVAIGMLAPFVGAGLVALVVNDPDAHPLIRGVLDGGAIALAVLLVMWAPVLGIGLAMLPLADLMNQWLDRVQFYYEEDVGEDTCEEARTSQPVLELPSTCSL